MKRVLAIVLLPGAACAAWVGFPVADAVTNYATWNDYVLTEIPAATNHPMTQLVAAYNERAQAAGLTQISIVRNYVTGAWGSETTNAYTNAWGPLSGGGYSTLYGSDIANLISKVDAAFPSFVYLGDEDGGTYNTFFTTNSDFRMESKAGYMTRNSLSNVLYTTTNASGYVTGGVGLWQGQDAIERRFLLYQARCTGGTNWTSYELGTADIWTFDHDLMPQVVYSPASTNTNLSVNITIAGVAYKPEPVDSAWWTGDGKTTTNETVSSYDGTPTATTERWVDLSGFTVSGQGHTNDAIWIGYANVPDAVYGYPGSALYARIFDQLKGALDAMQYTKATSAWNSSGGGRYYSDPFTESTNSWAEAVQFARTNGAYSVGGVPYHDAYGEAYWDEDFTGGYHTQLFWYAIADVRGGRLSASLPASSTNLDGSVYWYFSASTAAVVNFTFDAAGYPVTESDTRIEQVSTNTGSTTVYSQRIGDTNGATVGFIEPTTPDPPEIGSSDKTYNGFYIGTETPRGLVRWNFDYAE